ncbi:lasso peptide biosynthesis PqqD family chaperone [Paenibacillus sp. 5J-6]|uniref:Lasso peptide biosynthesis PqqD family chaperone n=1 Tax=Paenibacillus silvestris TaxID=2606219 RepID=A0A6L8V284_9BACL|nr:lasso peptide biosynthesis PqqD family chaperone [Paenibacillus silvestris]MZQ83661.1 lasso peptide biosynthesis PqqD family chaperone [Paenibacillus silvestris]
MIKNPHLTLQTGVVQEQGNIVSDMDGDKVMMNITNGNYYNLGQIGGRIWELIAAPVSVGEVVSTLMTEYEVEQSECEEQVFSFLKHLLDQKLIQIGDEL